MRHSVLMVLLRLSLQRVQVNIEEVLTVDLPGLECGHQGQEVFCPVTLEDNRAVRQRANDIALLLPDFRPQQVGQCTVWYKVNQLCIILSCCGIIPQIAVSKSLQHIEIWEGGGHCQPIVVMRITSFHCRRTKLPNASKALA